MNSRYVWVSIAAAALLTVASACLAQDATPPPAAPDSVKLPAARPPVARPMGATPGTGSIGGMLGGSYLYAADDYAHGAQPRMSFSAAFRYTMRPWLRWQVSPGFAWAAYTNTEPVPFRDPAYPTERTKDHHLALLLPSTVQLQLLSAHGAWLFHAGVGSGVYRVWLENHRKVVKDPSSLKLHRGLYPGISGEVGAERYLKSLPAVSVEGSATSHYALAKDDVDFPSGYNSALGMVELRFGANYHFSLTNKPKKTTTLPGTAPPPGH